MIAAEKPYIKPPFWFAAAVSDEGVEGCAIHAKPDGLCVSDLSGAALQKLTKTFSGTGIPVHRISGPEQAALEVADQLTGITGAEFKLNVRWRSFFLETVVPPEKPAKGHLRLANEGDVEVVAEWGRAYGEEKPALLDVSEYFVRKLGEQMVWCWDDDGIRMMIAMAGITKNGICVAGVFTPVENRKKGYASAAVAAVSQHYLDNGRSFCTLMVDKRDPHVMRVYENIGYKPNKDRVEILRVGNDDD